MNKTKLAHVLMKKNLIESKNVKWDLFWFYLQI